MHPRVATGGARVLERGVQSRSGIITFSTAHVFSPGRETGSFANTRGARCCIIQLSPLLPSPPTSFILGLLDPGHFSPYPQDGILSPGVTGDQARHCPFPRGRACPCCPRLCLCPRSKVLWANTHATITRGFAHSSPGQLTPGLALPWQPAREPGPRVSPVLQPAQALTGPRRPAQEDT